MGNNKVRSGLGSLFTTKGQLRKPRGRPQLDLGIQIYSLWKVVADIQRQKYFYVESLEPINQT